MNFDEKINIIYGDNAQGKTNILESMYVCATSKSHRGSKDREIIRFDNDESHIKVNVKKNDKLRLPDVTNVLHFHLSS